MIVQSKRMASSRHPWLTRFESAPEDAFDDLLAGYADIHPYERADPPDAARMLFGSLEQEDSARKALGPAILAWLEKRRKERLPASRPKLQRRVREICEAFEIVALLGVADAAVDFRQRILIWNDWVSRLVLSTARDARAEYWRTLGLTQCLVANTEPAINANGLTPMWQHICREAGGRLPRHYLSIGLLGLRCLPQVEPATELPWVSGLAQWALAQQPTDNEFKAAWLAIKPLYPRAPERWRRLVSTLLSARLFREAGMEPPAWWRIDTDFSPMVRGIYKASGPPLRSPSPEDCDKVIARFHRAFEFVKYDIDLLLNNHRDFVRVTGDHRYFVRAIHAIGGSLIDGSGDRPHSRAREAQALAREGLTWDPYNSYLWTLWADALTSEGAYDAAEKVRWESIRRIPTDPTARNQLATLLERLDRKEEAEDVLRQAIRKFPNDEHSRNQLAGLLGRMQRFDEAERLAREAIEKFPGNVVHHTLLATLLARIPERRAEAETVLKEAIKKFPKELGPRNLLAALLAQSSKRAAELESLLKETVATFPNDPHAKSELARLHSKSDDRLGDAERLLREALILTPGDTPLRLQLASVIARSPDRRPEAEAIQAQTLSSIPAQTAKESEPALPAGAPVDPGLEAVMRRGAMRHLRSNLESADQEVRQTALAELQQIFAQDPTFAYAELLAARYRIWAIEDEVLPSFAAAFEEALAEEDREKLEMLAMRQPRLEMLTLVARSLLGDAAAAQKVELWLRQPRAVDKEPAINGLHSALHLVLRAIEGGRPIADAINETRETVISALHDANEAALGEAFLAA